MITYKPTKSPPREDVYLDGKLVGQIIPSVGGGFRFRAKGGHLGAPFSTVEACKRSLETDR